MKEVKSINVETKIWNKIPVKNKSAFVEYAIAKAIEIFNDD